jgi:hypothetical protein
MISPSAADRTHAAPFRVSACFTPGASRSTTDGMVSPWLQITVDENGFASKASTAPSVADRDLE